MHIFSNTHGAAAGGGGAVASTFSGTLDGSSSFATVVGTSANYQLGAGNSGDVEFRNVVFPASGDITYNRAALGNVSVTEGLVVTFGHLNSLVMRGTGMASPEVATVDLYDVDTNTLIRTVTLTRT
jgi:hypothetical protein